MGRVHEIAARATTLVNDETVAIIVPNSQFISERVTNWSRPNALTAYQVHVHVARSADPEAVQRVLLDAAAAHADVQADPPAEVEFTEMGLAGFRFQLQVWSKAHLESAGRLKSDLNFAVWRGLKAAGVAQVPLPVVAIATLDPK